MLCRCLLNKPGFLLHFQRLILIFYFHSLSDPYFILTFHAYCGKCLLSTVIISELGLKWNIFFFGGEGREEKDVRGSAPVSHQLSGFWIIVLLVIHSVATACWMCTSKHSWIPFCVSFIPADPHWPLLRQANMLDDLLFSISLLFGGIVLWPTGLAWISSSHPSCSSAPHLGPIYPTAVQPLNPAPRQKHETYFSPIFFSFSSIIFTS